MDFSKHGVHMRGLLSLLVFTSVWRATVQLPHDDVVNACNSVITSSIPYGEGNLRSVLIPDVRDIVDIGGNIGRDIGWFLDRHPHISTIHVFEPLKTYVEILQNRFGSDPRVKVSNIGVSNRSGSQTFVVAGKHGVGSTGVDDPTVSGNHVQIRLRDVDSVLTEALDDTGTHVLNMNCEGCEYDVLPRMIERGWVDKFAFLQFSLHDSDFIPNRSAKRCAIEAALRKSHDLVYHKKPGWYGWKRRNGSAPRESDWQGERRVIQEHMEKFDVGSF